MLLKGPDPVDTTGQRLLSNPSSPHRAGMLSSCAFTCDKQQVPGQGAARPILMNRCTRRTAAESCSTASPGRGLHWGCSAGTGKQRPPREVQTWMCRSLPCRDRGMQDLKCPLCRAASGATRLRNWLLQGDSQCQSCPCSSRMPASLQGYLFGMETSLNRPSLGNVSTQQVEIVCL